MTIRELRKVFEGYGFDKFYKEYTDNYPDKRKYAFVAYMTGFDVLVHLNYYVHKAGGASYEVECITLNERVYQSTPSFQFDLIHVEAFLLACHQIDFRSCQYIQRAA